MLKKSANIGQAGEKHILSTTAAVAVISCFICALWGSAPTFIKMGYELFKIGSEETMNIMLFAGIRFALAGAMVIIFYSIITGEFIHPGRESITSVIALCLSQTVVQYFFLYIGVAHASGTKTSILSGSSSVISVLMTCLLFRQEKLTGNKLIGCIIGFIGIIMVNLHGSTEAMTLDMSLTGEGFVLLASVSGAVSSSLIRKFSQKANPVMLSGWQFFVGGLTLSIIALIGGGRLSGFSLKAIIILLYLGFVSAVAYTLRSMLLKYNPVSKVTVYNFLIPVFGVIMAAVFLGERDAFTLTTFSAMLLICLSIAIVNHTKKGGHK